MIALMGAWGFDRVYTSTNTLPEDDPTTMARWNSSLDDMGLRVQMLMGDSDATTPSGRTSLLNKVQSRLIDFNLSRSDAREHFDGIHLDIEPHTTDQWQNGSATNRRDILLELQATYVSVRSLLDSWGQTGVKIYADIPVWYDSSSSIGWSDDAQRDQWFQDIALALDGLSMMAYERSTLSSIVDGVEYEANNFNGEVRVGINAKEIGPGDTFEDYSQYMAMAEALEGDIGIPIGGVDFHPLYLFAELSPTPQFSADFDQDGGIDGKDFLAWQAGYATGTQASDGDADGNATVNVFDLAVWRSQYSTVAPLSVTLAALPEPSTITLLLGGWMATLCRRAATMP